MRSKFTSRSAGSIVVAPEGYDAFVPAPAPRSIDLPTDTVALLTEAADALGALRGTGARLRDPALLVEPYRRREAVLSSRIEGTQSSISDVYAAEAGQTELIEAPDTREVVNYIRAHEWGLAELPRLPLSLRLIRGLHGRLMEGVRGHQADPGRFRKYQNWIGGETGQDAVYVPPPVPQMTDLLDDFERFLHEPSMPALVQAGVLHAQFEAIHPFGDGNGRVGRLLIAVFLAERGLSPQPLLNISPYLERNRDRYYDALLAISTHGDWQGWLSFFLRGVREQAIEAQVMADRLLDLEATYRTTLLERRASNAALALLDHLFANPLINSTRARALLDVSAPTARAALGVLEEAGIVSEISGRSWRRTYRADAILEAISGPENG